MTNPQTGKHDVSAQASEQDPDTSAISDGPSSPASPGRSKQAGQLRRLGRRLNREPPWWVSQIVVAVLVGLVVGGAILLSGKQIDDSRAKRDHDIADQQAARDRDIAAQQARHAIQLENLRFVRTQALSGHPPYPFASLDLEGQDLSELPLRGAHFRRADLSGANLEFADFSGCQCDDDTNFSNAWLPMANLSAAALTNANFSNAMLEGVQLTRGTGFLPNGVEIAALVNAQNANFSNAYLVYAHLTDATLNGANFSNAQLVNADLSDASADHAIFRSTNLAGATLNALSFNKADFTNACLLAADLSHADLLENAILDGIYYDPSTTKWPAGFSPPASRPESVVSCGPRPRPPKH